MGKIDKNGVQDWLPLGGKSMKYRTFLTTFLLFLFFFNLGILIITYVMFKDTLRQAEERSLAEHYMITSAIVKDFYAIESRGSDIEESVDSLFQPYRYFSSNTESSLVLYKEEQQVYSTSKETLLSKSLKPPKDGNRLVSFQETDNRTYVIVSGKLPSPYDFYTLVYLFDTTDTITSWAKMKNTLFLVGLTLVTLLAFGLLLLLNRIFKPLSQITQTSREIAAGAYETRLSVSGNDELAKMSQSFNYMAEEIHRQMKELITAAEKKQQFIDNFAHELHTPLTAIYGYAEYLQKAALTDDDRLSAISYIMSESKRVQTLSNQLLDLANLKNDQIVWEEQNVNELFQSVKQTLHSKIRKKKIKTDFYSEIDGIKGDASLLKSLFVNLMDNAIKACEMDGHVMIRAVLEDGKKIVCIQDNGKGMSPEITEYITEPFYRVEKSRSRKDGGTGLGLSICKQIVLRHNADLEFISHPGKGMIAKVIFTTS